MGTKYSERDVLKGISFWEGEQWVAVCLDHYLMTFAPTLEQLRVRIYEMMLAHIEASLEREQEPFKSLPQAPQRYWDIWNEASSSEIVAEDPPSALLGPAFPQLHLRTQEQGASVPA